MISVYCLYCLIFCTCRTTTILKQLMISIFCIFHTCCSLLALLAPLALLAISTISTFGGQLVLRSVGLEVNLSRGQLVHGQFVRGQFAAVSCRRPQVCGAHFHVIASGQYSFFRRNVARVASRWQHCVRFDRPKI